MIQQDEVILLILGLGVLALLVAYVRRLERLVAWRTMLAAYCLLVTGWALSIPEGFLLQAVLNVLEHVCYAGSSVMLAVWCSKLFGPRRAGDGSRSPR